MSGGISNNSNSYNFEQFKNDVISKFECKDQDVKNKVLNADFVFRQAFQNLDKADGNINSIYEGNEATYQAYVNNTVSIFNSMARAETEHREEIAKNKKEPTLLDKVKNGVVDFSHWVGDKLGLLDK